MILIRPLVLWYLKVPDILRNQAKILSRQDHGKDYPSITPGKRAINPGELESVNDPAVLDELIEKMNRKNK